MAVVEGVQPRSAGRAITARVLQSGHGFRDRGGACKRLDDRRSRAATAEPAAGLAPAPASRGGQRRALPARPSLRMFCGRRAGLEIPAGPAADSATRQSARRRRTRDGDVGCSLRGPHPLEVRCTLCMGATAVEGHSAAICRLGDHHAGCAIATCILTSWRGLQVAVRPNKPRGGGACVAAMRHSLRGAHPLQVRCTLCWGGGCGGAQASPSAGGVVAARVLRSRRGFWDRCAACRW
ncbi:hypothetical protein ACFPM0_24220 [Pseudonocardia sulfidoxydans]|uniref:hypothetical protein n=1 Tax=Pseudonocardia sulfidoxydans TaxID=54011 RepID=UPI003611E0E3